MSLDVTGTDRPARARVDELLREGWPRFSDGPADVLLRRVTRDARLVAMGHKERDLVAYFLELKSRARGRETKLLNVRCRSSSSIPLRSLMFSTLPS